MGTFKRLSKSRAFYVGLLAIAGGLIEGLFDDNWAAASDKILGGLAIIFVRDGIAKGSPDLKEVALR